MSRAGGGAGGPVSEATAGAGRRPPERAEDQNGPADPLQVAIQKEQTIANEAAKIRAEKLPLSEWLERLMPLLRRPIPPGFIERVGVKPGKPYESTGVRSMQVQIDRMDNVLGPENWGWVTFWSEGGRMAEVTVWIGGPSMDKSDELVRRVACGGVDRASSLGNLYKGSETNAGKLAFARIGPGHEIYLGVADFDPDVSPEAASVQQTRAEPVAEKLAPEFVGVLGERVEAAGLGDHLDAKLRQFGVKNLADLTTDQGRRVWQWAIEPETVEQASRDAATSEPSGG